MLKMKLSCLGIVMANINVSHPNNQPYIHPASQPASPSVSYLVRISIRQLQILNTDILLVHTQVVGWLCCVVLYFVSSRVLLLFYYLIFFFLCVKFYTTINILPSVYPVALVSICIHYQQPLFALWILWAYKNWLLLLFLVVHLCLVQLHHNSSSVFAVVGSLSI